MNPLNAIYCGVVAARNSLYDRGAFRAKRLNAPVVSIGNISVGGTGKTPFTIALGLILKQHAISFDVLSRGYRRDSTGVRIVDPQGTSAEDGDEPLLIARELNVPVVVGESRYQAGLLAEQKFAPQLHLLDDGFQHRQLARDIDIVMLADQDSTSGLLPTGRLREPLSSLARAHVLVVDEDFDRHLLPKVRPDQQVWIVKRTLEIDYPPRRPVAFCGIAKPKRFFAQLRSIGVEPVAEIAFRDHHRYRESDIDRLQHSARSAGAGGFITTAKDLMNLGVLAKRLEPLTIASLSLQLQAPETAWEFIKSRCRIQPSA